MKSATRSLVCALTLLPIACEPPSSPSLECEIAEIGGINVLALSAEIDRSTKTDGVWNFEGKLSSNKNVDESFAVRGKFYRYPDDTFDLVTLSDGFAITIMPNNAVLQTRGIGGVVMRGSQTVATGTPALATCHMFGAKEV